MFVFDKIAERAKDIMQYNDISCSTDGNSENQKIVAKDILDINFDMRVSDDDLTGYYVMVNAKYRFNEKYNTEEDAEKLLLHLVDCRNQLENELRNF